MKVRQDFDKFSPKNNLYHNIQTRVTRVIKQDK